MAARTDLAEWKALEVHAHDAASAHIRDLVRDEGEERLSWTAASAAGLNLDVSKNRIDKNTLHLLIALAKACDLEGWRDRMVAGDRINTSENRAVSHMALRGGASPHGDEIQQAKAHMLKFVRDIQEGRLTSATGKPFTAVVNIGIGGSDLGPRLAADALRPDWSGGITPHFVANVDAAELARVLEEIDAETTLFIVTSKTFTTQETLRNAQTAREWLTQHLPDGAEIDKQFAAVTSNRSEALLFGVSANSIFDFWDWVGGRYSVWSSVGLALALAIGVENFETFLAGAAEMDQHFLHAPLAENVPVLLALIGVWNRNFLGLQGLAILPYDQSLSLLPSYLQQLDMESNGKQTGRDGARTAWDTGPLVFGAAGTTGQHAFYQWLHQGTDMAASEIILVLNARHEIEAHQDILLAHGIAQGEALAFGRNETATRAELANSGLNPEEITALLPHRTFAGNRPVSTIVMDRLCPRRLGALLAMYEHKVFSQGVIWNINSFDQWGVELGKSLAGHVLDAMNKGGADAGFDPSTRALVKRVVDARGRANR